MSDPSAWFFIVAGILFFVAGGYMAWHYVRRPPPREGQPPFEAWNGRDNSDLYRLLHDSDKNE